MICARLSKILPDSLLLLSQEDVVASRHSSQDRRLEAIRIYMAPTTSSRPPIVARCHAVGRRCQFR